MTTEEVYTLEEAHQFFAKQTNQRIWQLLEKQNRTPQENDELLYAAHASCYHWLKVGSGLHQQRGAYLIAKVYMNLQITDQAMYHAQRCVALTETYQAEMADFDRAFACECLARVYAMRGNKKEALKYYNLAEEAGQHIQDAEDKEIFEADFIAGDWFGLV